MAVPRSRVVALALMAAAVWSAAMPAVAAVQLAADRDCPCPLHKPPAEPSLTAQCECHELPAGTDVVPSVATPPAADASSTVVAPPGQALPPVPAWSAAGLEPTPVSTGPDPPAYLLNLSIRR
ncbi:MAG: hypothetical protein HYY06_02970 [Deltaproteobacteria bacterium]|nr:hypothetical protein [Deltaproteobacteria bacterium]